MTAETNLPHYLASKGFTTYRAAGNEVTTHCFAGETKFWTRNGLMTLAEAAGTTQEVLVQTGSGGFWKEAPIREFGEQELMRVVLRRNGMRREVFATPGHRWLVWMQTHSRGDVKKTFTTEELVPGRRLVSLIPRTVIARSHPSPFGIAAGFTYGDGYLTGYGASVTLWGEKDKQLAPYFEGCRGHAVETPNGVRGVRFNSLPKLFKTRPDLDDSTAVLYGWLAGYFAADGSVGQFGTSRLSSAKRDDLEFVQLLAARLGIGTFDITEQTRLGYGVEPTPIYNLTFARSTLQPDFFLINEHRWRFQASTKADRFGWTVESVERTDRFETVYCATVPEHENFTLDGFINVMNCFWCPDGDPKGKGRLYLNTQTWLYSCKRCDASGNRKTLLIHFGDVDEHEMVGVDPMLRRRILTEAAQLAHEMLIANKKKYQYLLDRGLTDEVIIGAKLGYVPMNVGISEMIPMRGELKGYVALIEAGMISRDGREFLNDCITIPYFSHGTVVQIRAKFVDGKYLTAGGDSVRLYNSDALFGADRVLITEGELDALAVRAALATAPPSERAFVEGLAVVGLPGAGSWPEGLLQMLEGPTKVFIGLDPDDTGKKFAAKLKDEVGQRARVVELPEGEPKTDWTDYLLPYTAGKPNSGHGWADVRNLLVEADLAGKQMFSIVDIATKWSRAQSESPGLKLGWPSLDAVLRPGLKPGQVMVPLAMTATGKTVWLSNVAHNLHKRHVLYVSLEMTATEVYEHLRRIHRFHNPKATREEMFHDHERLAVTERNRIGRGDLGDLIHEYQDTWGASPDLVIVDYLQYYARGFRGSQYERVTDAVMETKAVAKEEYVPIVIPSQVNRGAERGKPLLLQDGRDSGAVEETADFIPSLYRPDQIEQRDPTAEPLVQTGQFHVRWLKSRHGGAGKISQLKLSNLSLAIVDPTFDQKGNIRVEQENSLCRQGMTYDEYLKQVIGEHAQDEIPMPTSEQGALI